MFDRDGERKASNGMNLLICIDCLHHVVPTKQRQAITVFEGNALCREHAYKRSSDGRKDDQHDDPVEPVLPSEA